MSAPRLTQPQVEVLKMLKHLPRYTSTDTVHGFVNGTVVSALERKGLAQRDYLGKAEITEAGLAALKNLEATR